jgi:hypothetical protein
LKDVKALIRANDVLIRNNAIRHALNDFGWNASDIKNCLLKLTDRLYSTNKDKNHFHKTVAHTKFPNTMMDYYKAQNIMDGINVYTHFYLHPDNGKLIISSFKEI